CANTDPQRDAIFTKGPADVLDHATTEMGIGTKMGIDATQKWPGEGHKRSWRNCRGERLGPLSAFYFQPLNPQPSTFSYARDHSTGGVLSIDTPPQKP